MALLSVAVICACLAFTHGLTTAEMNKFWDDVTFSTTGGVHTISSTGMANHSTDDVAGGCSPVNSPGSQSYSWDVNESPTKLANEGNYCLKMGAIAIAVNGVPLYNPFASDYDNAVEGMVVES